MISFIFGIPLLLLFSGNLILNLIGIYEYVRGNGSKKYILGIIFTIIFFINDFSGGLITTHVKKIILDYRHKIT